MPTAYDAPTRFYGVAVSNRAGRARGTGLVWSEPYAAAREAGDWGRALLDKGDATLAFVVAVRPGGVKEVLANYTRPESARKVVRHYLAVLEALSNG